MPYRDLRMRDSPSFENPPVTEVVIAARFRRADAYSLFTLGELAQRLAEAGFSSIEERPGYEAPVESFGSVPEQSGVSLELLTGPPPIRYWFSNEGGDELLQIQSNWFAANWRKVAPEGEYGRWESRWDAFQRWVTVFAGVVSHGDLDFDQVEVTYINHIEPTAIWSHHGDAASVFTPLALANEGFLEEPEQFSANLKYLIRTSNDENESLGRLHVSIDPGFLRPAGAPIFVMNLTARGAPLGSGLEGVRAFAEIAHEWIVRGFADLTSTAMHTVWNRLT